MLPSNKNIRPYNRLELTILQRKIMITSRSKNCMKTGCVWDLLLLVG